jgi:hypothetical protein
VLGGDQREEVAEFVERAPDRRPVAAHRFEDGDDGFCGGQGVGKCVGESRERVGVWGLVGASWAGGFS